MKVRCALWNELPQATALVCRLILTDLMILQGAVSRGRLPWPTGSFPEPCSISEVSEPQQDSGILLCFILLMQPGFPAWIPAGHLLTSFGDHT